MSELKPCPAEHELKCWPEYYDAVERGDKPFEIRKWDRPYQVGDTLLLRRYDPRVQDYTGQQMRKKITYLLDLTYLPGDNIPHFTGYVAIGLAQPANEPLTLEQLREMDGEPVWIEVLDRPDLSRWHFIVRHPKIGLIAKDGLGQYECYPHNSDQMVFSGCYYDIQYGHNYGKTWLAYAHNPDRSEA